MFAGDFADVVRAAVKKKGGMTVGDLVHHKQSSAKAVVDCKFLTVLVGDFAIFLPLLYYFPKHSYRSWFIYFQALTILV